jgi:hypothetical protein
MTPRAGTDPITPYPYDLLQFYRITIYFATSLRYETVVERLMSFSKQRIFRSGLTAFINRSTTTDTMAMIEIY